MNINNKFWLEDNNGNTISDFYDDYIPVESPDNLAVDKFVFVMKDKFPLGEFFILNNDGSVFASNREFFDDYYNEDGELDTEAYVGYSFYNYSIVNTPDFCYVYTISVPYPRYPPSNISQQGDPRMQLLSWRSYVLSKKDGKLYYLIENNKEHLWFYFYLIGDSIKVFYLAEDENKQFSKEIYEQFIDYSIDSSLMHLYRLSKDDDTLFFISCLKNSFVLYDTEFNKLKEIPYSNNTDTKKFDNLNKVLRTFSSKGIEISLG